MARGKQACCRINAQAQCASSPRDNRYISAATKLLKERLRPDVLVHIIRHGQSYNTHPLPGVPNPVNPPLTPVGREEVRRLARRLAPLRPSRIVASAMLRTVETARIVAHEVGLPVEVKLGIHEFRETAGYVCCGGRELAARYPDLVLSPDLSPENWILRRRVAEVGDPPR